MTDRYNPPCCVMHRRTLLNSFDEKDFDKMATECFGYFTLNECSLHIVFANCVKMVIETKRQIWWVKCYL